MKIKKSTLWTAVVAVAATLIVLGAPGFAQQEDPEGPPFGPGMRGPRGVDFMPRRMLRMLDLSDDQWNQLRRLREDHFERTQVERDKLRETQKAFWDAVQALEEGHGNTETVRTAARAMGEAHAELAIVSSGFRSELMDVLTPEQLEKMKELRAEAQERMKDRTKNFRSRPQ